jgi:hypothetical protein
MILGRPPNLVLAAVTAVFNVVILALAAFVPPLTIDAGLVGGVNLALAAIIALIANTPPTMKAGDTYHIATPNGQPDIVTRVVTRAADDATLPTNARAGDGGPPPP